MSFEPGDIVDVLNLDHQDIRELFAELGASGRPRRSEAELFWVLADRLVRHEVAEEVVVLPALRQCPGAGTLADKLIAEQSAAEDLLTRTEAADVGTEEFPSLLAELQSAFLGHAEREDAVAIPLLRSCTARDERIELGRRYVAVRETPPHLSYPRSSEAPPGNTIVGRVAALAEWIRDSAPGGAWRAAG